MNVNKVAVIGECMVELQKSGDLYKQSFGGDTLNTALYLSRLTGKLGVTTTYITGLGKDPFSQQMLNSWQQEGIDINNVFISEQKLPGLYAIETMQDGERHFFYWRNDSAAKYWLRDKPLSEFITLFSQYQFIYLSGISLAILPADCLEILVDLLTACKQKGIKIAFDNNYRPTLWESVNVARNAYARILRITDIAFLTFDDEKLLYGDTQEQQAIDRTTQFGISEIVMKRGADDTYVIIDSELIQIPATRVTKVIDTTAAGDSFSAGYLAKRLTGCSPQVAAHAGNVLAGTVIQHRGAIIAADVMPNV